MKNVENVVSEGDDSRSLQDLRASRRAQEKEDNVRLHHTPDLINQVRKETPVKTPNNAQSPEESVAKEARMMEEDTEGEVLSVAATLLHHQCQENDQLLAFKATSDPDTMHMHQAMRQKDKESFKEAMKKEWSNQLENGNFRL